MEIAIGTRLTFAKPNNSSLLHEELLEIFPAWRGTLVDLPEPVGGQGYVDPLLRLETVGNRIVLDVPEGADVQAVTAVVNAHNSAGLSSNQKVDERRIQARAAYKQLTALRGMTPDQAEAWVEANVTTLTTAKTTMKLIARMLVILARAGDLEDG